MSTTFFERTAELRRQVGAPGLAVGSVIVDQVYAHYQHEHLEFRHPRGGEAKFLERPLFDHYRGYFQNYAWSVLQDGGLKGLKTSVEHLSDQVELHSPREFGDLMRSGHPSVRLGTRGIVYDREPKVRRLTEAELRMKNRLRKLPPEIIGYIWWKVMRHTEPPPHLRRR